jgi:hypothetical protein
MVVRGCAWLHGGCVKKLSKRSVAPVKTPIRTALNVAAALAALLGLIDVRATLSEKIFVGYASLVRVGLVIMNLGYAVTKNILSMSDDLVCAVG